jgi:hypothetical protein
MTLHVSWLVGTPGRDSRHGWADMRSVQGRIDHRKPLSREAYGVRPGLPALFDSTTAPESGSKLRALTRNKTSVVLCN